MKSPGWLRTQSFRFPRWATWRLGRPARFKEHEMIVQGPRGHAIALTFDDGPDPRWTPRILEILERACVRATFFLVGSQILEHPELARQIAARHEVGTHLFSHRRGLTRDRAAFVHDLERALAAHEQVLGAQPRWLRFPFGDVGRVVAEDWTTRGLVACHWSVNSHDVRTACAGEVVREVLRELRGGAIVLLHDGVSRDSRLGPGHREATVAALKPILDGLAERELAAVSIRELLAHQPAADPGERRS